MSKTATTNKTKNNDTISLGLKNKMMIRLATFLDKWSNK